MHRSAASLAIVVMCAATFSSFLPSQVKIPEATAAANLQALTKTLVNRDSWQRRAAMVRNGILEGAKLKPLPKRTELRAVLHSEKNLNGYRVANVAFESFPGFFVTGNLYRPIGKSQDQSLAGILCPHGHWEEGRFRKDMQARCATFARAGAVVFAYDMAGWQESSQINHKSNKHTLTYQIWNSMRAVDYLLSFKEVNPERLAITGASGGGTQSFLLAALDERIHVSAPVVMVSAHFFGGCNCESGLPIHRRTTHSTNNAEIAALAAPRPQLIVSDGEDWTKNVPNVEGPFVRFIYKLVDAKSQLEIAHFADEGHDYGASKRHSVYRFFEKHLGLDFTTIQENGEVDESFIVVLPRKQMLCFDAEHPRPDHALADAELIRRAFKALQ